MPVGGRLGVDDGGGERGGDAVDDRRVGLGFVVEVRLRGDEVLRDARASEAGAPLVDQMQGTIDTPSSPLDKTLGKTASQERVCHWCSCKRWNNAFDWGF